jgi:hypothetical protein
MMRIGSGTCFIFFSPFLVSVDSVGEKKDLMKSNLEYNLMVVLNLLLLWKIYIESDPLELEFCGNILRILILEESDSMILCTYIKKRKKEKNS